MAKLELVDICKEFGQDPIPGLTSRLSRRSAPKTDIKSATSKNNSKRPFSMQHLNLTIPHAQTMVVLGPSGCGKTTLLKIIAGLIKPDLGQVLFNGDDMNHVAPGERRIGMLFQNYALYPHMTAKTNILSYFFFRKKTPELDALAQAKYKRTSELLGVEIEYLQDRMPTTLSGGEKQRVALGRCITRDPALFLLDEPFSNLDPRLRDKYRGNLQILLKQFNITTVYVTHDQEEAAILADLIAIMNHGTIEQVGTYEDIYRRPTNIFVAEFLCLHIETPPINLIDGERLGLGLGKTVGVRPEDVEVLDEWKVGCLKGIIIHRTNLPLKNLAVINVRAGDCEIVARIPITNNLTVNDEVGLRWIKYHVFDKTGRRIHTLPAP